MSVPASVLVVEDSATQAEELRLILTAGGFNAETAPDAERALARLAASSFEIVISDIVMPGLSGYDLCRRIKSEPRLTHLPVLLLTSLTDPIDVVHALECGADSFLTKPCEPEHLLARVTALLESRRLRAAAHGSDIEVLFRGQRFAVPSSREQILDLLLSTFEDTLQKQDELMSARDALAAKHQAIVMAAQQPVRNLQTPAGIGADEESDTRAFLQRLNEEHAAAIAAYGPDRFSAVVTIGENDGPAPVVRFD